eukprot:TRINITY_DN37390_c0_g1_i1.p1 TRINITY_DN37390_c0_g1~~TRINITY_DN37390_c0_g1_i1.p1  ORF type:complete len:180 (+),score=40.06 TRINITY_DN37390_c0_g1_i1:3-542(+)
MSTIVSVLLKIRNIFIHVCFFFFFKQKTAYEMLRSLVGSEMCIRDRNGASPPQNVPVYPSAAWGAPAASQQYMQQLPNNMMFPAAALNPMAMSQPSMQPSPSMFPPTTLNPVAISQPYMQPSPNNMFPSTVPNPVAMPEPGSPPPAKVVKQERTSAGVQIPIHFSMAVQEVVTMGFWKL